MKKHPHDFSIKMDNGHTFLANQQIEFQVGSVAKGMHLISSLRIGKKTMSPHGVIINQRPGHYESKIRSIYVGSEESCKTLCEAIGDCSPGILAITAKPQDFLEDCIPVLQEIVNS